MFCDQFNMGNADYSVPVIKTHSVILYLENSVKSWSEKNLTFFFFFQPRISHIKWTISLFSCNIFSWSKRQVLLGNSQLGTTTEAELKGLQSLSH